MSWNLKRVKLPPNIFRQINSISNKHSHLHFPTSPLSPPFPDLAAPQSRPRRSHSPDLASLNFLTSQSRPSFSPHCSLDLNIKLGFRCSRFGDFAQFSVLHPSSPSRCSIWGFRCSQLSICGFGHLQSGFRCSRFRDFNFSVVVLVVGSSSPFFS